MWRSLHSLPGVLSLVLIAAIALSGAALAIYPVQDKLAPEVQSASGLDVAQVTAAVAASGRDIDNMSRSPSGALVLHYFDDTGMPQEDYIDATTGETLSPVAKGPSFYSSLKTFHRSLMLGDKGRWASGAGALILAILALSGLFLMVSRMGGWRHLFDRPKGNWSSRIHTIISRIVLLPLTLSALTGVYIALTDFEYIPVNEAATQAYPESTQDVVPVQISQMAALKAIPLAQLRKVTFPMPGDTTDVFTVKTSGGIFYVDQATGTVLEHVAYTWSETLYEWFYTLHTGVGMAWMGVVLALASLTVPLIGATGVVLWWRRTRGNAQRIASNAPAGRADIVLLVGSEGGATWGFAKSLHRDLRAAGHSVHVAPMNAFRDHYTQAKSVILLASTYGNGSAPSTADKFLSNLALLERVPNWSFAVLGFGDRAFPHYCQFAKDIDADLVGRGWNRLLPASFVNRQSTQAFASWGVELAEALGESFTISHTIDLPRTRHLTLVERTVYGEDLQEPTAVLRFRLDEGQQASLLDRVLGRDGKRPRFAPSDLLGILPPASSVPRFYSVASVASNEEVEICVKRQPGGECSGFLHRLEIGGTIECFVRTNPDFRVAPGRKPIIMISAGTGLAPFMGMVRANDASRDVHLFWGGRTPDADFLYRDVLETCQADGRLRTLTTAFSRVKDRAYVQDKLRQEGERLREMLSQGASVMVCGGDAMARAVSAEIDTILEPIGLNVLQLKTQGAYAEDIF